LLSCSRALLCKLGHNNAMQRSGSTWRGTSCVHARPLIANVGLQLRDRRMNPEWNPARPAHVHHHGAKSVANISPGAIFTLASRLAEPTVSRLNGQCPIETQSGGFLPRGTSFVVNCTPEYLAQCSLITCSSPQRCCSIPSHRAVSAVRSFEAVRCPTSGSRTTAQVRCTCVPSRWSAASEPRRWVAEGRR
jgi:hypothetical protein